MKLFGTRSSSSFAGWAKKTTSILAALAIFVGIAGPSFAGGVVSNMQAYLAAWNAHDADKAAGFLVDDVTYFDASVGEPLVGREAAKVNVIEAFMNAAPDSYWEPVGEPVVNGNTIAFEWKYSGTNTGDWSDGTPATGKAFSFNGMSIFRFVDDKIEYQGDYYDALGFYVQLGLM